MTALSFLDVVVLVVAAPIMLLIGVPAGAYGIAAGAWIVLRALGVGVERYAIATKDVNRSITDVNRIIGVRLGYMLGRLFALAIVVILLNKSGGQNSGLTALAVIVFAFTVQLITSALSRPRTR
jgi:hypothetical protein